MNIMHSSRTDSWGTPKYIIDLAREVLGPIEFDPASDVEFNKTVDAYQFYTREDAGKNWPKNKTIWLNPPGGKTGNRSNSELFWSHLMEHRGQGLLKHAIFMAFSVESLQTTQRNKKSIMDFPFCVPAKRIHFVAKTGLFSAPSHSNVIVYVPGTINKTVRFSQVFSTIGKVKL